MKNLRQLWVVEHKVGKTWVILPNTVNTRKVHPQWDAKCIRESEPTWTVRVVRYVPEAR